MTSFTATLLRYIDMPEDVALEAVALYGRRHGNALAQNRYLGEAGGVLAKACDDAALVLLLAEGNPYSLEAVLAGRKLTSFQQLTIASSWCLSENDLVRMAGASDTPWRNVVVLGEDSRPKRGSDDALGATLADSSDTLVSKIKTPFGAGSGQFLDEELAGMDREQTVSGWRWLWALGEDSEGRTLRELLDVAKRLARD